MNFCQPGAGRGVASGREIPYGRDISTIERQTTERDYEADDVLVVDKRDQLRALAHDLRATLVALLRERAGSIRVVRTRQVRAVTEKYYGRVAWLFVIRCADAPEATGPLSAAALRRAADELEVAAADAKPALSGVVRARLRPEDARRFERRLERLVHDVLAADTAGGRNFVFASAFFPKRADA